MVEVKNLSLGYRSKNDENILLSEVTFLLNEGNLYTILGSNGKGKTSLLQALSGFSTPLQGHVLIQNKDISKYTHHELSKMVSVIFTERPHIEYMTVFEMVSSGRTPHTGFYGKLSNTDIRVISNALLLTGITALKNRKITTLSDGEYQKTLIAKSLAQETPIILMDEPATYLDVAAKINLMKLLRKLVLQENKTIVISTHDIDLAIKYSDQILMFNDQKKLIIGMPEDLIINQSLSDLFKSQGLLFNSNEGSFSEPNFKECLIKIEADEITKKWLENALARYPEFNDKKYHSKKIFCDNENLFQLFSEGRIIGECQTIDELITSLRNC